MCKAGGKFDASGRQPVPEREAAQAAQPHTESEINWNQWWPFDRATGTALRLLNRKPPQPEFEEALL